MRNIHIIGTSHIAKDSVNQITSYIREQMPDIVAIELDKSRLVSMLSGEKKVSVRSIAKVGLKGFLFAVVGGYIQRKLGKVVGIVPGADMLAAVNEARNHHLQLALIDQRIDITLKKFSSSFSWKEKWRLLCDVVSGFIHPRKELQGLGIENLDLTRVPSESIIRKLLGRMKQRYPNLYRVLVFERNHIMANNLYALALQHPKKKILAVVGAGHRHDIEEILDKIQSGKIEYTKAMRL